MEKVKRTPYPFVFWVANLIEVLERFSYYGIYMGFGIYMEHLGYSRGQLGIVQSFFLLISYMVPIFSGTFADRFGFKKVLIISYLAYLPSILLLILTRSFSGIALTMLSIALAAGIFKPLISGTVRVVTDKTNTTMGFGIFYLMVNVGASFGPIIAGKLRAISWNYAFIAAAIGIAAMLLITIFFYKEPPRQMEGATLGQKFKDLGIALSDVKFTVFLVLLGVFFWLPFWSFFNILALYIDKNLDTASLYQGLRSVFGRGVADFFSHDDGGVRKLLGETIAHTGFIIMILQFFVSKTSEKFKPIPCFLVGLIVSGAGCMLIGYARVGAASLVFLGITLFAIGEMIASPRIQEYITWLAPKEKAGLYMGANFLSVGIGGFTSGLYTWLYGIFRDQGSPERIWYVLGANLILATAVIQIYTKSVGRFEIQQE